MPPPPERVARVLRVTRQVWCTVLVLVCLFDGCRSVEDDVPTVKCKETSKGSPLEAFGDLYKCEFTLAWTYESICSFPIVDNCQSVPKKEFPTGWCAPREEYPPQGGAKGERYGKTDLTLWCPVAKNYNKQDDNNELWLHCECARRSFVPPLAKLDPGVNFASKSAGEARRALFQDDVIPIASAGAFRGALIEQEEHSGSRILVDDIEDIKNWWDAIFKAYEFPLEVSDMDTHCQVPFYNLKGEQVTDHYNACQPWPRNNGNWKTLSTRIKRTIEDSDIGITVDGWCPTDVVAGVIQSAGPCSSDYDLNAISAPTMSPSPSPTRAPSVSPTGPTSSAPSMSPVFSVTETPTQRPTFRPTAARYRATLGGTIVSFFSNGDFVQPDGLESASSVENKRVEDIIIGMRCLLFKLVYNPKAWQETYNKTGVVISPLPDIKNFPVDYDGSELVSHIRTSNCTTVKVIGGQDEENDHLTTCLVDFDIVLNSQFRITNRPTLAPTQTPTITVPTFRPTVASPVEPGQNSDETGNGLPLSPALPNMVGRVAGQEVLNTTSPSARPTQLPTPPPTVVVYTFEVYLRDLFERPSSPLYTSRLLPFAPDAWVVHPSQLSPQKRSALGLGVNETAAELFGKWYKPTLTTIPSRGKEFDDNSQEVKCPDIPGLIYITKAPTSSDDDDDLAMSVGEIFAVVAALSFLVGGSIYFFALRTRKQAKENQKGNLGRNGQQILTGSIPHHLKSRQSSSSSTYSSKKKIPLSEHPDDSPFASMHSSNSGSVSVNGFTVIPYDSHRGGMLSRHSTDGSVGGTYGADDSFMKGLEIDSNLLLLGPPIGTGSKGRIFKATYAGSDVAVKELFPKSNQRRRASKIKVHGNQRYASYAGARSNSSMALSADGSESIIDKAGSVGTSSAANADSRWGRGDASDGGGGATSAKDKSASNLDSNPGNPGPPQVLAAHGSESSNDSKGKPGSVTSFNFHRSNSSGCESSAANPNAPSFVVSVPPRHPVTGGSGASPTAGNGGAGLPPLFTKPRRSPLKYHTSAPSPNSLPIAGLLGSSSAQNLASSPRSSVASSSASVSAIENRPSAPGSGGDSFQQSHPAATDRDNRSVGGASIASESSDRRSVNDNMGEPDAAMEDIINEVEKLRSLRHPNIIQLFGCARSKSFDTSGIRFLLVMELAACSLMDLIMATPKSQNLSFSDFTLDRRINVARQVASGCAYIHENNIIHCDIKPENILLDSSGTAKICDLGIAKYSTGPTHTVESKTCGTPAYMAPELLHELNSVNFKIDVFSYGIVLWQIMFLKQPHPKKWTIARLFFEVRYNDYRPPLDLSQGVGPELSGPGSKNTNSKILAEPELVQLTKQCWAADPELRPEFLAIIASLDTFSERRSSTKALSAQRRSATFSVGDNVGMWDYRQGRYLPAVITELAVDKGEATVKLTDQSAARENVPLLELMARPKDGSEKGAESYLHSISGLALLHTAGGRQRRRYKPLKLDLPGLGLADPGSSPSGAGGTQGKAVAGLASADASGSGVSAFMFDLNAAASKTFMLSNNVLNLQGFKLTESGVVDQPGADACSSTTAATPGTPSTPSSVVSSTSAISRTSSLSPATFPPRAISGWITSGVPVKDTLVRFGELGKGASGSVFAALYLPTFQLVAVKEIHFTNRGSRHQAVRELNALYKNLAGAGDEQRASSRGIASSPSVMMQQQSKQAPTRCPYIVWLHEAYYDPISQSVCLVMEHFDGGSLQDHMDRMQSPGGTASKQRAAPQSSIANSASSAASTTAAAPLPPSTTTGASFSNLNKRFNPISRMRTRNSSEDKSSRWAAAASGFSIFSALSSSGSDSPTPPPLFGKQSQQSTGTFSSTPSSDESPTPTPMTPPKEHFSSSASSASASSESLPSKKVDLVSTGVCYEKTLVLIARSILKALAYLHQRSFVHLDIKPANVLINSRGEVKLSDFGLARQLEVAGEQFAQTFVGSIRYMSPLRLQGEKYSFPSDIFSFALTMLSVTMGHYPEEIFFGSKGSSDDASLNSSGVESDAADDRDTKGSTIYWKLLERWKSGKPVDIPYSVLHKQIDPITGKARSEVVTFSNAYRNFLSLAMELDPSQRPTAEELLQHEWVRSFPEEDSDAMGNDHYLMQSQETSRLIMQDISICTLNKARSDQKVRDLISDTSAMDKAVGIEPRPLDTKHAGDKKLVEIDQRKLERLASELQLSIQLVERSFAVAATANNLDVAFKAPPSEEPKNM